MAALTYNLKKYLKFGRKTPNILTQALQAPMNIPAYTKKTCFLSANTYPNLQTTFLKLFLLQAA
ncbi:MAG: hypothetical protein IPM47_17695 [Sphingobacteriales bacterium]|nr:MAG: hypothetical protein IPM47_17695 [Sphingobacteriales bacterium]